MYLPINAVGQYDIITDAIGNQLLKVELKASGYVVEILDPSVKVKVELSASDASKIISKISGGSNV